MPATLLRLLNCGHVVGKHAAEAWSLQQGFPTAGIYRAGVAFELESLHDAGAHFCWFLRSQRGVFNPLLNENNLSQKRGRLIAFVS